MESLAILGAIIVFTPIISAIIALLLSLRIFVVPINSCSKNVALLLTIFRRIIQGFFLVICLLLGMLLLFFEGRPPKFIGLFSLALIYFALHLEYFSKNSNLLWKKNYYSKNEQPVATKQRIAPYENELEYEPFGLSELFDCSDAQAFRALNQEEEFETNFKGFATDGTASYLLVGENKPEGYISALLVKSYTPLINKLMSKEGIMRGVPIEVDFEKVRTTTGTYQMLLGVRQVNR